MEFHVPAHRAQQIDKIALIDADAIKYRVLSKLGQAKIEILVENSISYLYDCFEPKAMLFCFSGPNGLGFRDFVAFQKEYKGTRKKGDPDYEKRNEIKEQVVDYIKNRYPTLLFPELEADDILSMLQDDDTFIYSEDKDLLQVPGTHWDIKKSQFYEISEPNAIMSLLIQMIEGDVVDNISGLQGAGAVTSQKLLSNQVSPKQNFDVVLNEYIKKHGFFHGVDSFVESWNLLKLRLNRGGYFREKYFHAFETLEMLKL